MAQKRNCGHKNYLTAKGFALRIKNVVNKPRYEDLKRCVRWYVGMEEVKNDLVLYFIDVDDYTSLMAFLRERCMVRTECGAVVQAWDYFTWRLDNDNISVKEVTLSEHVKEVKVGNKTISFEEYYNSTLESTTRDESGKCYTSRTSNTIADKSEEPAIMQVYSVNEFRVNGHF